MTTFLETSPECLRVSPPLPFEAIMLYQLFYITAYGTEPTMENDSIYLALNYRWPGEHSELMENYDMMVQVNSCFHCNCSLGDTGVFHGPLGRLPSAQ